MKEATNDCGCRSIDRRAGVERLRAMTGLLTNIRSSLQLSESLESCPNVAGRLTDLAYETEGDVRAAIALGLRSVNEVFDGDVPRLAIGDVVRAKPTSAKLQDALRGLHRQMAELIPDADASFLEEAINLVQEFKVELKSAGTDGLAVSFRSGNDKHEFVIDGRGHPGDSARISVDAMFGRARELILAPIPIPNDPDCHHEQRRLDVGRQPDRPVDAYGSLIAACAVAKEVSYRRARLYEELGPPRVRGRVIPLIVVILVIIALVMIAAGGIILAGCDGGDIKGAACDWGKYLVAVGLVVGVIAICVGGACATMEGAGAVIGLGALAVSIGNAETPGK